MSTGRFRARAFAGLVGVALAAPGTAGQAPDPPLVVWSPTSVRYAGMNGAGAALVGHAATVFTNPASLATIRHVAIETAYQVPDLDAYVLSGALGWRLGQFDLGFGIRHFDLGSEAETMLRQGADIGADTTSQLLGVGSLVYRFPLVAVGVSAKYVRLFNPAVVDEGTTVDVGMAIAIFDIMALGLAVQNVGGNWRTGSSVVLPRLTRFGFTLNYTDPQLTFRLMSTVEGQWESGRGSRFVLGNEAGIVLGGDAGLVGRFGYASRRLGGAGDNFSFGLTLELDLGNIDVGYQPDELTNTAIRRIGFRFAF